MVWKEEGGEYPTAGVFFRLAPHLMSLEERFARSEITSVCLPSAPHSLLLCACCTGTKMDSTVMRMMSAKSYPHLNLQRPTTGG